MCCGKPGRRPMPRSPRTLKSSTKRREFPRSVPPNPGRQKVAPKPVAKPTAVAKAAKSSKRRNSNTVRPAAFAVSFQEAGCGHPEAEADWRRQTISSSGNRNERPLSKRRPARFSSQRVRASSRRAGESESSSRAGFASDPRRLNSRLFAEFPGEFRPGDLNKGGIPIGAAVRHIASQQVFNEPKHFLFRIALFPGGPPGGRRRWRLPRH